MDDRTRDAWINQIDKHFRYIVSFKRRLADATGHPDDIADAELVENRYRQHQEAQRAAAAATAASTAATASSMAEKTEEMGG